jgi:outer membrane cobalamin receptor
VKPAALALALLLAPAVAHAIPVRGQAVDHRGAPVEYANVAVPALGRGTVTDDQGRFTLDLPEGVAKLEVTQIGYQKQSVTLTVAANAAELRVVLAEEPVPVAEVTVAASSFGKAGKSEGAVIRRTDVVTTPGGTADIFQSLRTLPGINAPNEGAALYVRGGDPHETVIRLDSGVIGHPYHYEDASGGLFSTIDSYMLKSAFFSSGGFSAKYGGALSGVLDIETQDPLDTRTVSVGANMAGMSASTSWALAPGKLSFIGSLDRSTTGLLIKLYGSANEHEVAPVAQAGFAKLLWRPTSTDRVSLAWLHSGDAVRMHVNVLNVLDRYTGDTGNDLVMLNSAHLIGTRLALRTQASVQDYGNAWGYGPFGGTRDERNTQANVDAVLGLGPRHEVSFGASWWHGNTDIGSHQAADSTDYTPDAPTRIVDTGARLDQPGFYLEDKVRVWGPLYATLGARTDRIAPPGVWTFDPRGALAWRVDAHQTVRVAAGRYHQAVDAQYLDAVYGNPDLAPLAADHVIAGYEWKSEYGNVRVEGYEKRYHQLVTTDSLTWYANGGNGYARGVDVFVQGTWRDLSGWLSYGYLDSKRRELDDVAQAPSAYGVDHSVTLVSMYQVTTAWRFGARLTATTGRPYTPVIDRTYDASRDLWQPVYGDHRSALMPAYHRLDLRVTRLFSLPAMGPVRGSSICAFYVEGLNVLGIENVLEYVYNSDYSGRYPRDSYFSRRMLVAGVGLTW